LETEGEPRRLVAAQALGYHRQWLSSQSVLKRLLGLAREERDPLLAATLVWCLRANDEVQEFLLHQHARVAREAALGVPVGKGTLAGLARAFLVGRADLEPILLHKFAALHPSLVPELLELLLQAGWEGGAACLEELFVCLPQVPLFEAFLEARALPKWAPQPGHDPTARTRNWHQFVRVAEQALQQRPSVELLRHLLSRSAEDDAFTRRHAAFQRAALRHADVVLGPELLRHVERLTAKATEDKLGRLAQLLVELNARLEGKAGAQVAALLEEWKKRSPHLKLRIYHLQQGLK
jgi:hypothetical protein